MNAVKARPFLICEDISAIGTMSLGVAMPILAAMAIPVAALPSQVLSTQSEGFDQPATLQTATWLPQALKHWQQQQISLSGSLIGYVGDSVVLERLTNMIKAQQPALLVVDPVMADDGQLYPGLPVTYVDSMRGAIKLADVITPNWTESQLLTGVKATSDEAGIKLVLSRLRQITSDTTQMVITGIPKKNQIVTAYWDGHDEKMLTTPSRQGHFYGSGDVFAALLSGWLTLGKPLSQATQLAIEGVSIALDQTASTRIERRFGMQLSHLLKWLVTNVEK